MNNWAFQADIAVAFEYALPHAVLPQLLRPLVAAASGPLPPAIVQTADAARGCVDRVRFAPQQEPQPALVPSVPPSDSVCRLRSLDIASFPARLPLLTALDCSGHLLEDGDCVLRDIARLPSVQDLRLASTNVTTAALSAMTEMPNLRTLDLSNCDNVDIATVSAFLPNFPNLEVLGLPPCPANGSWVLTLPPSSVTSLWLKHSTGVNAHVVGQLARVPPLTELDLSGSDVGSHALSFLRWTTQLKRLVLCDCRFVDNDALDHVAGVSTLEHLDVSGSLQIDSGGLRFLRDLPLLSSLTLRGFDVRPGFCASIPSWCCELKHLTALDLQGESVVAASMLSSFKVLTQLRSLSLSGHAFVCDWLVSVDCDSDDDNAVDGGDQPEDKEDAIEKLFATLGALPCLTTLDITNCSGVSERALRSVSTIPNLHSGQRGPRSVDKSTHQ